MKFLRKNKILLLWIGFVMLSLSVKSASEVKLENVHFTNNNEIVFFRTGAEKFQDLFKAIEGAHQSIHMEYFNFRDDSIANLLFDVLVNKHKEGVEVRLLYDAFGNSSNNQPIRKAKLKELQSRGLDIREFDPIRFPWLNHALHRDHRKIVVIDGHIAYSGGMNVADYYIIGKPEFGEWRDVHFRVTGDVVNEYQKIFLKIWKRVSKEELNDTDYLKADFVTEQEVAPLRQDTTTSAGKKRIAVINREPHTSPKIIRKTFVDLLNGAERKVQLINPYLTLNHKIYKAMKKAVERGVDLEIIVSEKSDIPITPQVVDYYARKLMNHGAKVYYFQGGFHHSKIMMVDDKWAYVGSANLNARSLAWDYEVNALVQDTHATCELKKIFDEDKAKRCIRLTDEYWKQHQGKHRFSSWCCHLLRPFL